jgi:hypothetical protein
MIGIKGNPYIDCSSYIDLSPFTADELNFEICAGLALSNPSAGVYGPGILDAQKFGNFMLLDKELRSDTSHIKNTWLSMNHNQRSIFAKLYYKLYNPSSTVYLRSPKPKIDGIKAYLNKHDENFFTWTESIKHFPQLMQWINSELPKVFDSYGRILFFIHDHDCKLLIHRDGFTYRQHKNEFIWINPTTTKKKFFIYDDKTEERYYVDSPVVFFNDLDMHGGDPCPNMTWSLRIDGIFTQSFKDKLGIADCDFY